MISNWLGRVQRVRFLWPVSAACPAMWDEMFEPLQNLTITPATEREANRHRKPVSKVRFITLKDLTPSFEIPPIATDYVAVHVRRTDHEKTLENKQDAAVPDEEYFRQIDATGLDKIYLATDNAKTQRIFMQRYGNRIIVHDDVQGFGSRVRPVRCTSMQHAVADLYQCFRATHFIGTPWSSFSSTIRMSRDHQV